MPIWWPLKVPERGNAITQRKTLEIEHSCLFIHHTIWIYPFPHMILLNTPKKSLLKSSYPSQIFVPQKIPESKISNPKKSFDHLRHLKSRGPPLGWILKLINHFWGLSHFLSDKVSPGWRLKPSFGTQKKCPIPLFKGVPSVEYNKYKDYVNIFSGPNFVSIEWNCPKEEVPLWTENWAHPSPSRGGSRGRVQGVRTPLPPLRWPAVF